MAVKVRTWIWIVVGVVAFGILCVIVMAGAGMYYVARNIETRTVSSATASDEFEAIRKKFAGQKPLIELDDRGNFLRANTDRPAPTNAARPETLYVLAFDPDDGGLVRVSVPFWLLRIKTNNSHISFSGNQVDLEDLKLSVEDLERFGPSLILDQKNGGGDRVLVWSQ
jgi:hypothetical protein